MVLDRANRKLSDRSGSPVPLRYRSMNVLLILAETPGENVDRQTIVDAVWPDTHVSEDSLAQCIADIRRALGDTERNIVETVPRLDTGSSGAGSGCATLAAADWRRDCRRYRGDLCRRISGMAEGREQDRSCGSSPEDLSAPEHAGYLSDALSEGHQSWPVFRSPR